jgi:uncharacterized coiled-coil protein SlyX
MAGPTTEILASDLKDLTREVQGLRSEFLEFRGQASTIFSLLKWLGGLVAVSLIGVMGALLTLTWHASKLDSRVSGLETATTTQSGLLRQLEQAAVSQAGRLDAQSDRLDRLEQAAVAQSDRLDRLEQAAVAQSGRLDRLEQSVERLTESVEKLVKATGREAAAPAVEPTGDRRDAGPQRASVDPAPGSSVK